MKLISLSHPLMARRAWVLCVGALVLRDAHAIAVLRTPCAATRGAVSVPRQTSALLALDAPADVFPDAYASAAERDAAYEKAVLAVRDAAAKFGGNQAEVAERWARAQIDECPVAMDAEDCDEEKSRTVSGLYASLLQACPIDGNSQDCDELEDAILNLSQMLAPFTM